MAETCRPKILNLQRTLPEVEDTKGFVDGSYYMLPLRIARPRAIGERVIWSPHSDMYEKEDSFVLRFELPDIKPEDVSISVRANTLTVRGEHRPPEGVKEGECRCAEICYGTFARSVVIPAPINADKVQANLENGILEVCLPKAEEVKHIKVRTR